MAKVSLSMLLVASLISFSVLGSTIDVTEVSVEAIPLLTEVEQGKPAQQSVMLRLQSPEAEDASQDQHNYDQDLVIVLDVSGSMRQGGKLEKAKAAISGIVNSLRPNDRLHLVTYHSSARVEFTGGTVDQQEKLLAQVAELSSQSSTNLYAGLQEAEKILGGHSESVMFSSVKRMFGAGVESRPNSVKRMFLFSDGLVNVGVTDRQTILGKVESLRSKGTTTSAFGIGADYDQELMSAIAEAGHGEFFFIRGQEDMEKVVRVATAGFQSLFATEAQIQLTAINGATGLHVYGQGDLQSGSVTLGDLRSGDARTLLVDLMLPSLDETTDYLAYELEYVAMGAKEPSKQRGHLSVSVVTSGAPADPNNAVLLFRKLQQHLLREEEIEHEVASGAIDKASTLEDGLEEDLKDVAHHACLTQDTREQAYTCSRATAAWSRTKQSQALFKSGSMHGEMASKAYMFKRQMNMELSESKDEL